MKHISATATTAEAWDSHAPSKRQALPGMGSLAQQPVFRPVFRRDVMTAVNICRRELGLRHGPLAVLDALLSFLPCKAADGSDSPVSGAMLLTIFASNESLCFRAKGLTDRQLRRNIEVLEAAGLVQRRDSANGKRFPILQHGKAIGAFGIDLSPLFARSEELLFRATRKKEEDVELRGVRAQILHLRAACQNLALSIEDSTFVDGLRNLMRRAALTLIEAKAALRQLTAVMNETTTLHDATLPAPADGASDMSKGCVKVGLTEPNQTLLTEQTPASDRQNVRHKETESDTKKREPHQTDSPCWSELTEISAFYPEPRDSVQCRKIAFEFGKMLRLSHDAVAKAISRIGIWPLLKLQDYLAEQSDAIRSPEGYLRSILAQSS